MLVASARRGKLTALVALARRDTNRVAVAGISPGLSASETPGLGVAGGIIHIYRVAVAAKRPTGLRRNDQRGCGETNDGFVAKRTTGLWRNERRVCGETTNGGAIRMVLIDADELPQPLRGNINKLTRYPASPGFRWRSTPGYIPQPLRG